MGTPGPAARQYLAACADTRKAWYAARLLPTARVEQIRHVRQVLQSKDAAQIAKVLCEVAGPTHLRAQPAAAAPASLPPALAGVTKASAWQAMAPIMARGPALAEPLLQAIIQVVLDAPAGQTQGQTQGQTPGQPSGQPSGQMLDVDRLLELLVHWIEHGHLGSSSHEACDAWRIGQFLRSEFLRSELVHTQAATADEQTHSAMRLACVAVTAPAVESARVMSRLSEQYLQTMQATQSVQAGSPWPAGRVDLAASPMARSTRDDRLLSRAFGRLQRPGFVAQNGAGCVHGAAAPSGDPESGR